MKRILFFLIVVNMLVLSGCKRSPRRTTAVVRSREEKPGKFRRRKSWLFKPSKEEYYVVRRGDTLWNIARKVGISVQELKEYNGISAARSIKVGQKIYFPPNRDKEKNEKKEDDSGGSLVPNGIVDKRKKSGNFVWPLDGKIVTAYGQKVDGAVSNGVEIKGTLLSPYVAAGDGEVVVSAPMKNYGVVTCIKHRENFFSLYYAYSNKAIVEQYEQVSKGQTIGYLGRKAPQDNHGVLHFEFRKRDKAINPLYYLPKRG